MPSCVCTYRSRWNVNCARAKTFIHFQHTNGCSCESLDRVYIYLLYFIITSFIIIIITITIAIVIVNVIIIIIIVIIIITILSIIYRNTMRHNMQLPAV